LCSEQHGNGGSGDRRFLQPVDFALFLKMTQGACAQALDHDTFDFWKD